MSIFINHKRLNRTALPLLACSIWAIVSFWVFGTMRFNVIGACIIGLVSGYYCGRHISRETECLHADCSITSRQPTGCHALLGRSPIFSSVLASLVFLIISCLKELPAVRNEIYAMTASFVLALWLSLGSVCAIFLLSWNIGCWVLNFTKVRPIINRVLAFCIAVIALLLSNFYLTSIYLISMDYVVSELPSAMTLGFVAVALSVIIVSILGAAAFNPKKG